MTSNSEWRDELFLVSVFPLLFLFSLSVYAKHHSSTSIRRLVGEIGAKVPPHGAPGAAASSQPVFVVVVVVDAAAAKEAEKAPAPATRGGAAEDPDCRRESSECQGARQAAADVGYRRHGARVGVRTRERKRGRRE